MATSLDDIGIEKILTRIRNGKTLTKIAKELDVSVSWLSEWLSNPERSARAIEARTQSAFVWDDKAEDKLEEAADPFELSRAKELAHHYRWRASKIAPKQYGEKVEQTHTGEVRFVRVDTGVPRPTDG